MRIEEIKHLFGRKYRLIKARDILSFFMLPPAYIASRILRLQKRRIWVICERRNEARDNGSVFFQYCMERGSRDREYYYAIDAASPDLRKLKRFRKNLIRFGSFRHWVYYLACEANISTQKNSGPNDLAGYVFRKSPRMNRKMIFLQHGTICNDLPFLHYKNTHFRLLLCSAVPEYEFVKKTFGYPADHLAYIGGQCRFDLLNVRPTEQRASGSRKRVLILPTWRDWLFPDDARMKEIEGNTDILQSSYFRHWKAFLENSGLKKLAEEHGAELIFYPHPSMQRYLREFRTIRTAVRIADPASEDLQKMIALADLLVTDYSSVFFDFVYMAKPIVFYQFDSAKFRKHQYPEGYFSYRDNRFSTWADTPEDCIRAIADALGKDCRAGEAFLKEREIYFPETKSAEERKKEYFYTARAYQAAEKAVQS